MRITYELRQKAEHRWKSSTDLNSGQAASRTQTLAVPEDEIALPLASKVINESLGDEAEILVALIAATEPVRLPGIEDLSIFELNVRLGLGKTRINKQLSSTIQ